MTALNVQKLANKMCQFLCDEYQITEEFKLPSVKILKGTVIGSLRQINPRVVQKYVTDNKVVALYSIDENRIIVLGPSKGFNYSFESYKFIRDRKIGAVYSTNPNIRTIVDLAHEVAHWFRYQTKGNLNHDRLWREYYGVLREEFVNHRKGVLVGAAAIVKENLNKKNK